MKKNLTNEQKDYAIYLPAIGSFFASFIGLQRYDEYVLSSRMPPNIPEMEMLNFFNDQEGLFQYKWGLYSAGHAELDLSKPYPKDDMIRNRDPKTVLVADSGGFQIAKARKGWIADWSVSKDSNGKLMSNCTTADKIREDVVKWLTQISDYSMVLDVPAWVTTSQEAMDLTNIRSYEDALNATKYNNHYFIDYSRQNNCTTKFLNVLQGTNITSADKWYEGMKEFNDPNIYGDHCFKGWAMGGINMADPYIALRRIVTLIHDGLLQEGVHDWMHFLGTGRLEWAVLLTAIQRAVRKTHNKNFTISFDCASPFLAAANGQVYYETTTPDYRQLQKKETGKWSYRMDFAVSDKKYSTDTRSFGAACVQDKIHNVFEDSPISSNLRMNDICVNAPGDLNKLGKEGKTSWDGFSYTLLQAHNVWCHINAVQESNRKYDEAIRARNNGEKNVSGAIPKILIDHKHTGVTVTDVVDELFSLTNYKDQLKLLEKNKKLLEQMPGSRGMGGKKSFKPNTESLYKFFNKVNNDIDPSI